MQACKVPVRRRTTSFGVLVIAIVAIAIGPERAARGQDSAPPAAADGVAPAETTAPAESEPPADESPASETSPAESPPTDSPPAETAPAESGDSVAGDSVAGDSVAGDSVAGDSETAEHRGPVNRAELEAFFDGIMAVQLPEKHVAGATVCVVVDGQPLFAKGYGDADVAAGKPVDADTTLFRIGSVSKLFTWTAVMQLVEAGKLDLHADINTYLVDFKISETFPKPITLAHLMTHTPGFEDRVVGLFAREPQTDASLGELLAQQLPQRVRPPGELTSYSNHGTAIAGYIVEQVSGMPWADYVEQHILEPLGMRHTLLRQPAADELPPEMSKGYAYERGRFVEKDFEYVPLAPAGSFSSSAGDMARFMIAHLQDGRYEDARILEPHSARQMRELVFTPDVRLDGMGYGFLRLARNGEHVVHHGGDTILFHSLLALVPDRGTGLFVSYNTESGGGLAGGVLEAFLDRYFSAPEGSELAAEPEAAGTKPDALTRYAGSYGALRYSHTEISKLGRLMNVIQITADDDSLVVNGMRGGVRRFVEVEPLLFRQEDDQARLAFRQNDLGQISHLFVENMPVVAYEKLAWDETPQFVLLWVGCCAAVFLSAVIGWPWAAFIAWGAPRTTTLVSLLASAFGWLTSLAALAWLLAAVAVLKDAKDLVYGPSPAVDALLAASPIIAALVTVVLLFALVAWLRGYWRFSGRLHYTLVLLAGLAFVWFLHYANLLQLPTA